MKRGQLALVAGGVLSAAGGVTVNRVGGSVLEQAAVFAVASGCFIGAGAAARLSGSSGPDLRLRIVGADGQLPQLSDLEPGQLGVHWSAATDDGYGPYVERDTDRELNEAISGDQSLVVVSGAALAGRTRTLSEAARRHLPGSWLAWFEDTPGRLLADLVAEAQRLARGGPVVLWLENADLPLVSQFSAALLDGLRHGFRIFMSLDAGLVDSSVLPAGAAEVLNAPGACIRLGLVTDTERERLSAEPAYAGIAVAHEDQPVLMGRLMVSLDRVTDALQTPDEDAVRRVAVLHAAVDWQRAAVPIPLTRDVLEKLYRGGYWQQLARRDRATAVSRSGFRQAVDALLAPSDLRGTQLLDEIYSGHLSELRPHPLLKVIADSSQRPPGWPISAILWDYLDETLDSQRRLTVGLTAYMRRDQRHAQQMLEELDPADIPASVLAGIAFGAGQAGQTETARRWYAKAISVGHPDISPGAMVNLGSLENKVGQTEAARDWWVRAVSTGHPDQAPAAMLNLGLLASRPRHTKEARDWWVRAVHTGHPQLAPAAMVHLGRAASELGQTADARDWLVKAVETGHSEEAPKAMSALGSLEKALGHIQDARDWLVRAIDTNHPVHASGAMINLGSMEKDLGETDEARDWWVKAVDAGHPEAAPMAMNNLGGLEKDLGHIGPARDWLVLAADSGHPRQAPRAMYHLGNLEQELSNSERACDWYAKAIESGHTEFAPKAMVNLGVIKGAEGDTDKARALLMNAIGMGDPEATSTAMLNLGGIEMRLGHMTDARNWWVKAVDTGYPEVAPEAMYNIGVLEQELGHIELARDWYAKAIASGHPKAMQLAEGQLDQMRRSQGDTQRAESALKYGAPYIDADFQHLARAEEPTPSREDESPLGPS